MSISGISASNTYNYTNYRSTSTYNTTATSTTQTDQTQNMRAGGPPPGGGKGPGGPPPSQGPDLDSDSDGSWSLSELEDYADYSSESMGIELNTTDIMSTYDSDGDGSISSTEQEALAAANAFNLPSPNDMMNQMKGGRMSPVQEASSTDSIASLEETTSSDLIKQLIEAYNQSNYETQSTLLSTVSFEV